MQRPQTRNRMIRYRKLVMEFDELSAVDKKNRTVEYAYLLGTVTNPTLEQKFLETPVMETEEPGPLPFDATVIDNQTLSLKENTFIPSFLNGSMPDLEDV